MAWQVVGVLLGRRGLRGSIAGHERQEHAARPALLWAAGARRPEVEETLRPLDGHRTITESFILTKLTKPLVFFSKDKALGMRQLSRPTAPIWQRTYSPFAICKNVQPIFKF